MSKIALNNVRVFDGERLLEPATVVIDRGVIAPGKRADLVLIDGDPLQDISAISKVAAVWCGGVPVDGDPARAKEAE